MAFEPQAMGVHEDSLVMVCDNCQVKDFRIRGLASDVDIQLVAIDGLSLNHEELSRATAVGSTSGSRGRQGVPVHAAPSVLDMPLWFGEVVPGAVFTKRLTVHNTTTLPFPFK